MHRVVAKLHSAFHDDRRVPENIALQKAICGYLRVADQSLTRTEIENICRISATVFLASEGEVGIAIDLLSSRGILRAIELDFGEQRVELICVEHELVQSSIPNTATRFVFAQEMYDYFSEREKRIPFATLRIATMLYRLAKLVDPEAVSRRAFLVTRLTMSIGSLYSAAEYFNQLPPLGPNAHMGDFLLHVEFLISWQRYERALKLLTQPPNSKWGSVRYFQVLRAVVLNRCRLHTESIALIDMLLNNEPSSDEIVVLGAFKMSGLLHEQKAIQAAHTFAALRDRAESAVGFGYFLRNGAGCFPPEQAIRVLHEALAVFDTREDFFGAATTLANIASYEANTGNYENALSLGRTAYKKISAFGIQHVDEALVNVGGLLLFTGHMRESEVHLLKAVEICNDNLPKVYAHTYLAALYALDGGRDEQAMVHLKQGHELVLRTGLPIGRQRFFANATLISWMCSAPMNVQREYRRLSNAEPYGRDPSVTYRILSYVDEEKTKPGLKALQNLFSAGYLEYWALNPVKLLPETLLTFNTI